MISIEQSMPRLWNPVILSDLFLKQILISWCKMSNFKALKHRRAVIFAKQWSWNCTHYRRQSTPFVLIKSKTSPSSCRFPNDQVAMEQAYFLIRPSIQISGITPSAATGGGPSWSCKMVIAGANKDPCVWKLKNGKPALNKTDDGLVKSVDFSVVSVYLAIIFVFM